MKWPQALALFSFASILGCAHWAGRDHFFSGSRLPPSRDVSQDEQEPKARNEKWAWLFLRGEEAQTQKNREQACVSFRELSREKDFPLKDLALLRAFEACPGTEELPAVESLSEKSKAWFQESELRAREVHFDQLPVEEQIEFLWKKAQIEKKDRAREIYLLDALGLAEKSGQNELRQEAEARLWKNSPRLKPKPEASELGAVAADLRRWREFSQSLAIEDKRLKAKGLSPEDKFQILKSIRLTHKVAQNKASLIKASKDLLTFSRQMDKGKSRNTQTARRRLEAETLYARTVWTENQRDTARRELEKGRRELLGRVSLEEVDFILARMSEEAGKTDQALAELERALQQPPAINGLKDKIRWARAWILYKANRKAEAQAAFAELASQAKEASDQVRSLYWQSRTVETAEERRSLLLQVREKDPLGFYGLLTYRDLQEEIPPLPASESNDKLKLWQTRDWNSEQALVAEWLLSLGLTEGVALILEDLRKEISSRDDISDDSWLRLAGAYARAGEFIPLFSLIGTLPPERRNTLLKDHPELLFPTPYRQEVDQAAEASGLPPEMIYAIMRQESAFNPRARSPADAFGLMQLLPRVAAEIARQTETPWEKAEDLYKPEIAVRLGAFELKRLLERWKDQWIPAVAAYNASEKAVRGWLRHRGREDTVEFIEEIPYEETRGYVKLVMRNQIFYRRLLAQSPSPFPENCLRIARSFPD